MPNERHLGDKARDLKSRKVQQLGELVIATRADTLTADAMLVMLIVLPRTRSTRKMDAWAAFFQSRSRRSTPTTDRDAGGTPGATDSTPTGIRQHGRSTCHARMSCRALAAC